MRFISGWKARCSRRRFKPAPHWWETNYEIESPDDRERVAAVLRNARNGCWVRAAVANPTPFEDKSTLNGERIYFD